MTTLESNRCYVCRKFFCCSECCANHIKKKHPGRESKCPLCRMEKLMVKNFDNQEFLCHVVFHHLPLHCRLCGEEFKNCSELASIGLCNRRPIARVEPIVQDEGGKSLLYPETPSPLNKTPSGPLGPQRKEFLLEGDYNGNFGNFTSPPELSRNTSTPMQLNLPGHKSNFAFKTPRSPSFTPKTEKTVYDTVNNARGNEFLSTKENNVNNDTNSNDVISPSSESIYVSLSSFSKSVLTDRTSLRSILSNRSIVGDNSSQESLRGSGRKLGAMQELDENVEKDQVDVQDMELTNPQCMILPEESLAAVTSENVTQRRQKENKDSVKRVRFSDQFEIKSEVETTCRSDLNATENEEFFEARQSLSEMSMAVIDKLSSSSALINQENKQNSEKEKADNNLDTKSPEPAALRRQDAITSDISTASSSSSSSRVVMMVVVEKNGSVNAADLAPLIDSSLKKFEVVAASAGKSRNCSIATPSRGPNNGTPGTSVVSVDSYMSVSSVECYSTPDSTMNVPHGSPETSEQRNAVTANGGIFSAVAHAMKSAFRNLSGASSSKIRDSERKVEAILPSSTETSDATSSNVISNIRPPNSLFARSAKRSRDSEDLGSSVESNDSLDPQQDVRSPIPKRPRGWYKIRGREPIARMRNNNLASPRGISLETQCFQQGSLSVGDTVLPIPSRAHQSTQTD